MNIIDSGPTTAIDKLRRQLLASVGTKQVVMIASASHGEGTSTVTAQLAVCLAKHGTGLILAGDLNLEEPKLHELLEVDNRGGVLEVLNGKTKLNEGLQTTKLHNLSVLTSGRQVWDITKRLESRTDERPFSEEERLAERPSVLRSNVVRSEHGRGHVLRSLPPMSLSDCQSAFSDMRGQFDFTLLDSPPINMSPEGLTLAPWVDGVLLVVRAGHTRREVVQHAKEQIQLNGGKILGVVLNRRRYVIPDFLYRRL